MLVNSRVEIENIMQGLYEEFRNSNNFFPDGFCVIASRALAEKTGLDVVEGKYKTNPNMVTGETWQPHTVCVGINPRNNRQKIVYDMTAGQFDAEVKPEFRVGDRPVSVSQNDKNFRLYKL